ncbi:MAG TPA: fimbria/pilus outer membrane usher protein [Rhizomicrobium sp.]
MTVAHAGLAALAAVCGVFFGAAGAEKGAERLLLAVWINGHASPVIAKVIDKDGAIFVEAADLNASGIRTDPAEVGADGMVALAQLGGVRAKLVSEEQRLQLTADDDRLVPQVFDLAPPAAPEVATAGTGFIGTYDLSATVDDFGHARATAGLGAVLNGTLFTPLGSLTSNGFVQSGAGRTQVTRLDTAAEFDEQDSMRRWSLGDAISGGLDWSRPARFAGLQIASDFELRPDLATFPLPSFFGQTAVPATLDVFVNAAQVFETGVAGGPFEIDNLPIVSGAGEASIVIRDLLGRQTTAVLPFFATDRLLRPGLSSYDLDIGFLRRNYGTRSFDYRAAVLAGTYRIGVTSGLTLEAHGEATAHVQLAGGGAAFSLGHFGVMQIAAAGSSSTDAGGPRTGVLYSASIDTQSYPVGFFATVSATSGRYEDIATIGGIAPPKLQLQLGANLGLADAGSLTASWIALRRDGRDATRLASVSYTLSFADGWYIGTTGLYDCVNRTWTAETFLSIALGGDLIANATAHVGSRANEEEASLIRSVNPDGGFGYRVSAATGDGDSAQAEATWIEPHGSLDAAVAATGGRVAGRLLATGGVVAMDGALYATQMPNGAVALVHTGAQDVRVFRENRPVATADSDGDALITGLVPFTGNRISIDPRDYGFSTVVDTTDKVVVPRRMSGVIVDLAPTSHDPAIVVLHLQNGNPPPAGSRVTLNDGGEPLVVGRDGEIFIADFPHLLRGTVEYGGETCHFDILPPAVSARDAIARLGPVLCAKGGGI